MVNLKNRNQILPPGRYDDDPPPPFQPPPPPLPGGANAGRSRGNEDAARGRGRAGREGRAGRGGRDDVGGPARGQEGQGQNNAPPPPCNPYHEMLIRMGFSPGASASLENLGLDDIQSFSKITDKDIPSVVKELCRTNVLVRQTSQNYLQALRYWVLRQERLQVNYRADDFSDLVMRESLQRYQASLDPVGQDLIKPPEQFKDKNKWRDFSKAFITSIQNSKGQCDFSLSNILRENDDAADINPDDYVTIDLEIIMIWTTQPSLTH